MQLYGVELGVLPIDRKDLSCARGCIDARHENVALGDVRSELLTGCFSNRLVCALPIELSNGPKGDRLKYSSSCALRSGYLKMISPSSSRPSSRNGVAVNCRTRLSENLPLNSCRAISTDILHIPARVLVARTAGLQWAVALTPDVVA